MAVNTHRTLFLELFFMQWCRRCSRTVFTQLWNCRDTLFFWTWELGPNGTSNNFPWCKLDICSLQICQKNTLVLSPQYNKNFGLVLCFLKETDFLPLLARKSSENLISSNPAKNSYGRQKSQNLLPWPLSFNMETVYCVLGVYLHSSETAGILFFFFLVRRGWGLMVKAVF